MLKKLHQESGCSLAHEQIRQVVLDTNEQVKGQLRAIMSGGPAQTKQPVQQDRSADSSKPPPPAGGLSRVRPSMRQMSWNKTVRSTQMTTWTCPWSLFDVADDLEPKQTPSWSLLEGNWTVSNFHMHSCLLVCHCLLAIQTWVIPCETQWKSSRSLFYQFQVPENVDGLGLNCWLTKKCSV